MRIAFVVDRFPTLSETFILGQITGLIDRGHEVDIYCDRPGMTIKIHPEVEQYKLLEHTYYTPIPTNFRVRIVRAIGLFRRNFFKAPKILLQAVNFIKYNRSLYGDSGGFLRPLYLAIPWLDNLPYDIILAHYGRNGLKATLFKDLGITQGKIVVTFHGYDLSHYIGIQGERVYDHLFNRVDLLQPISQHWQRKLIELGCDRAKVMVHHMGIDCNKFECINHQAQSSPIRLISIARLVEKKGLQYSIQAVAQLIPRHPHLEYQIVGDGVLKQDLEQLIEQLNVGDNVKLLGWRQQQEVASIIEQAHIVLAPSVTSSDRDCEGIPVSLMESMAKGLPVISTYHSGIPELIEDGVSGYLVPERDIADLAEKIEYLIVNPEIKQKMGQAGRKRVETDYNIELLNDRLVQTFQQLMQTNTKSIK
ncbi:MAG: glycosyltransferase [Pleurocapsa sp. MO_192.B19]|nr:glycosyltransferase [Pleurocapsa sp. MO_192.B19]